MTTAVRIHPADSVAVTLSPISAGDEITAGGITVRAAQDIPSGHKIALVPIAAGESPIRYGFPIGHAVSAIEPGDHVHSHNVATSLAIDGSYRYEQPTEHEAPAPAQRSFMGYRRADGSVGTRNEIWIIPTVGCVGRTSDKLAAMAERQSFAGIDGVHAFPHPFGCSQLGDDLEGTGAILAALACNPNAGGVLLLGLGCESNQLASMIERLPEGRRDHVRWFTAQGVDDEIERGMEAIEELARHAAQQREPVPLSALRLGVKCGGSDGLSGVTANPLIGRLADAVGDAGGHVLLTEIPEIFGAEQVLMDRCVDRPTFDALAALVGRFKRYFADHGEPVSENPSPGNIRGGITTLEEKSLGAVQKGGHVPVTDVIYYGQRMTRTGLTVLEAPGNDAVSTTALAAAGATLTLFSTGRGTPLGSPVPTVKVASNSALAAAKPRWIDINAGDALDAGMDAVFEDALDTILAIASGTPARNESNGERGIAIWKRGVTL